MSPLKDHSPQMSDQGFRVHYLLHRHKVSLQTLGLKLCLIAADAVLSHLETFPHSLSSCYILEIFRVGATNNCPLREKALWRNEEQREGGQATDECRNGDHQFVNCH